MPNTSRIIDWRLTWILAVLWGFNLFQVISVEFASDFAGSNIWFDYYRQPSFLEIGLASPQFFLIVLPAIWIAMAGSTRPWRLMIASLVGLHVIFLGILATIYHWGTHGYSHLENIPRDLIALFFLTLLLAFVLLTLRFWGWNVEDVRPRSDSEAEPITSGLTVQADARLQFSLSALLLWSAGAAIILSVLSTLFVNYLVLEQQPKYLVVTVLTGLGVVVLSPLVMFAFLCKQRWTLGLILLAATLCVMAFVRMFLSPIPFNGSFHPARNVPWHASVVAVMSVIWIGLQLLLVRAAGYRFRRAVKGPIS